MSILAALNQILQSWVKIFAKFVQIQIFFAWKSNKTAKTKGWSTHVFVSAALQVSKQREATEGGVGACAATPEGSPEAWCPLQDTSWPGGWDHPHQELWGLEWDPHLPLPWGQEWGRPSGRVNQFSSVDIFQSMMIENVCSKFTTQAIKLRVSWFQQCPRTSVPNGVHSTVDSDLVSF